MPLVSVIIPVRNECAYVETLLASVLSQEIDAEMEILVADGMSDDGTNDILDRMAHNNSRIHVIQNRGRIVSTGLNAAIQEARGEIIIRIDAHTEYAKDYISRCVSVLQSTGADNVGGPWLAKGGSFLQSAIALAFRSPFSSGGASSHRMDYEGPVDSVYLGCWRKETLLRLGLFDEELVRNQDDELNLRLIRAGGKIWQSPSIRSWYRPRSSLKSLFLQYMQYGYWKVRVIQKHRLPASVRHLVPPIYVMIMIILLLAAPWFRWGWLLPVLFIGLYCCFCYVASLITCSEKACWKYLGVMPFVFAAYHIGYGWGFLRGVVDFIVLKRRGSAAYGKLTR
jgi:glycosyltransferase involved in cell wall biosynthesis